MQIQCLSQEDPLEEGLATHSSIFAWRNPMDRGAWWASPQNLKSWTQWSRFKIQEANLLEQDIFSKIHHDSGRY